MIFGLTSASQTSILSMYAVVDSIAIVRAVYESGLCANTTQVVQQNGSSSLTKEGPLESSDTWTSKVLATMHPASKALCTYLLWCILTGSMQLQHLFGPRNRHTLCPKPGCCKFPHVLPDH